jgi:hypothetical protein
VVTKTLNRRIVYPITQWQRELVLDVVEILQQKGSRADAVIAELLNFLPEVQLGDEPTVTYGWKFAPLRFKRCAPKRPLRDVLSIAEDFDDMHQEIMLARFRAYRDADRAELSTEQS